MFSPPIPARDKIKTWVNSQWKLSTHTGQFSVQFNKVKPNCAPKFAVTCEDFRQNQEFKFSGVACFDPTVSEASIMVNVTASNLTGSIDFEETIQVSVRRMALSEVLDLETMKPLIKTSFAGVDSKSEVDTSAFAFKDLEY